jgi:hypothetical protein
VISTDRKPDRTLTMATGSPSAPSVDFPASPSSECPIIERGEARDSAEGFQDATGGRIAMTPRAGAAVAA